MSHQAKTKRMKQNKQTESLKEIERALFLLKWQRERHHHQRSQAREVEGGMEWEKETLFCIIRRMDTFIQTFSDLNSILISSNLLYLNTRVSH
uniref:Uncharacterized protein n=1 Tax=Amphimedon queenslandica TaxID=400682 RepID=A0A1X7UYH3_AMPQE